MAFRQFGAKHARRPFELRLSVILARVRLQRALRYELKPSGTTGVPGHDKACFSSKAAPLLRLSYRNGVGFFPQNYDDNTSANTCTYTGSFDCFVCLRN